MLEGYAGGHEGAELSCSHKRAVIRALYVGETHRLLLQNYPDLSCHVEMDPGGQEGWTGGKDNYQEVPVKTSPHYSKYMVRGPVAWTKPGNVLEMQNLRPRIRPALAESAF